MHIFSWDKLIIIYNKLYLYENQLFVCLRFDQYILIYSELSRCFKVEINATPISIQPSNCKFQLHTYIYIYVKFENTQQKFREVKYFSDNLNFCFQCSVH